MIQKKSYNLNSKMFQKSKKIQKVKNSNINYFQLNKLA